MKLKSKVFVGFLATMIAASSSALAATDTNNATVGIRSGTLTIDYVETTPIAFPQITTNGVTQTVNSALEKAAVLDNTGTGDGWTVTLQASRFTEVEASGYTFPGGYVPKQLPANSLTYKGVASTSTTITTKTLSDVVIDGASAVTVAAASAGEGQGATDIIHNNPGLSLTVNTANNYVNSANLQGGATPYQSTLTWTVVAGP